MRERPNRADLITRLLPTVATRPTVGTVRSKPPSTKQRPMTTKRPNSPTLRTTTIILRSPQKSNRPLRAVAGQGVRCLSISRKTDLGERIRLLHSLPKIKGAPRIVVPRSVPSRRRSRAAKMLNQKHLAVTAGGEAAVRPRHNSHLRTMPEPNLSSPLARSWSAESLPAHGSGR